MTFDELKTFLESKMRMSHIYQPVMIKALLEQGGRAADKEIAKEIAKYDQSQIEYYQKITNDIVGQVLRSHNVVVKYCDAYSIEGYQQQSSEPANQRTDPYLRPETGRIYQTTRRTNMGASPQDAWIYIWMDQV